MSSDAPRPTRATHAPAPRPLYSADELGNQLANLLQSSYALDNVAPFMVFCEGTTDVRYTSLAAQLAIDAGLGDPLRVPSGVAQSDSERIALCTPRKPNAPTRGGIPQMVRLAEDLKPYVFTLRSFGGVLFVFDGDEAGTEAIGKLTSMGYKSDQHMIALSKSHHPNACADRGLVIEDLLSLAIQKSFFDLGGASCDVVYSAGELVRFKWHHVSKGLLSEHVASTCVIADLDEIISLLRRIRSVFGFA